VSSKENKYFCILPWLHTHVWADGSVFPCCMGAVDKPLTNLNHHDNLLSAMNHPNYVRMRSNMLAKKTCGECVKCYELENAGGSSMRTDSERMYADRIRELNQANELKAELTEFKLRFMDVRFSNLCNLACVTCSPLFSQKLYAVHKKMGEVTPETEIIKVDAFEKLRPYLKFVTHVNFAGGEPLISEEHYQILQFWEEQGQFDININYTSNMTLLSHKDFRVINYWKKFKNISILASLDDFGDDIAKIRKGAQWNKIAENIRQIKTLTPHIHLKISPTVSILNIHRLFDMVWLYENEFGISPMDWQINVLQYPEKMSIKHLSPKDKIALKSNFETFKEALLRRGLDLPPSFHSLLGIGLAESRNWQEFDAQRDDFLRKFEESINS
jgi:hypothetical protein